MMDPYAFPDDGPVPPEETPQTLYEQLRARDPVGWDIMQQKYARSIYRWCKLDGLGPEDAKDVAQDVLVSVYRSLETFDRDKPGASFRAWIRRIVASRVADFRRRAARQPACAAGGSSLLDEWPAPGESRREDRAADYPPWFPIWQEIAEAVRQHTHSQTWNIFTCYVCDGWTAADTAEAFSVTEGYVRTVKSRMLSVIREENERRGNPLGEHALRSAASAASQSGDKADTENTSPSP